MSILNRVSLTVSNSLNAVDDVFNVVNKTTRFASERISTYAQAETVTSQNRLTNLVLNINSEFVDEQYIRLQNLNTRLNLSKTDAQLYAEAEAYFS